MDFNEFAGKIKAKYPAYADMDNRELAQKMVAKFPQYSDVSFDEPSSYQPSMLESAAETLRGVGNAVAPVMDIASKIGGTLTRSNDAMALAGAVGQGFNRAGEYVAEQAGEMGYPNAGAGLGMAVANIPNLVPMGRGAQIDTSLARSVGKPGIAARVKQMRTGVEASAFEQLRRDPTAFFLPTSRADAGAAVGAAKEAAGISRGVTEDVGTLTSENIARARNLSSVSNKAQDEVIRKLSEGATPSAPLPIISPGQKTGTPHALFAYVDDFGPGGTKRNIYNVFGDPENPAIKQRGWGSSVTKEDLDKAGIPITGREPSSQRYEPVGSIGPNETSLALEGINKRLAKIERSEGRGSPTFQQWSTIKSHFQKILEGVAPDVKQANQEFSRVALRDKFMEPMPVNQSGTMSKISSFGFTPLAATAGGVLGGVPGAIGMGVLGQAARSPFVAGLGTATRGLIDKAVDPAISAFASGLTRRPLIAAYIDRITTKRGNE